MVYNHYGMTGELDYILGAGLIVVLLIATTYGVRVAVKGRANFERIDRQGGSRLLNKRLMEGAYWVLQPVARFLVLMRITPNEVTYTSLGFGFLAGACLVAGHFGFAAIFATLCGLLDSLDGMIARLSGVASEAGEILDASVDRYVEFFFLSGLVIYYREIPLLQILTLLALLGSFMVSYSTAKAEALALDPPRGSMRRPERALYLTSGAALSAVTIPWLETQQNFARPIGYPMVLALGFVAMVANVSAINRFWSIAKISRLREKELAGARHRAHENALTDERNSSQISHHAADTRP